MSDILDLIDGAISNHQWTGNDEMRWRPPDARADERQPSGPITGVWFVPPFGEPIDLTPYIVLDDPYPTRRGPILNGSCTIRLVADTYGAFAALEEPLAVRVRWILERARARWEDTLLRPRRRPARISRMHSAYHRRRR